MFLSTIEPVQLFSIDYFTFANGIFVIFAHLCFKMIQELTLPLYIPIIADFYIEEWFVIVYK